MPRCRAAAIAAAVRSRGSRQRSLTNRAVKLRTRSAGSNSASARGRIQACVVAGLCPAKTGPSPVSTQLKTIVPTDRKSIFSPDSSSSSRTNSEYIRALAAASSRNSGRVSVGQSTSIPPAAHEASRPGSPFSTISTRRPCLFSSRARDSPMMPAPMMIASQVLTPLF